MRGEPYTEKGSKFFGFLARVENVMQFNDVMTEIKKEYRKASHYCFAYNIHEKTLIGEQVMPQMDIIWTNLNSKFW